MQNIVSEVCSKSLLFTLNSLTEPPCHCLFFVVVPEWLAPERVLCVPGHPRLPDGGGRGRGRKGEDGLRGGGGVCRGGGERGFDEGSRPHASRLSSHHPLVQRNDEGSQAPPASLHRFQQRR